MISARYLKLDEMDSKVMFANIYVAYMLGEYKQTSAKSAPICLFTMFDRIMTYKSFVRELGTKTSLETYLRLLVITSCDMHVKQELMEEIRQAM